MRQACSILRNSWIGPLTFVLVLRLLLNIPALWGARHIAPEFISDSGPLNPLTLPGVWSRWDSGYYLSIAAHGYSIHGPEVNFWPGYPLAIRILSLGFAPAMPWAAVGISFLGILLASTLLWIQIASELDTRWAWGAVITLNLFPTSFFFSAIYSESLFLLFSVLVYWFSARRHYWLAALFVALASITRIYGILLLILVLGEMVRDPSHRSKVRMVLVAFSASALLIVYAIFLWITQGSPLASVSAQQDLMRRSITLPGVSLAHSLAVALLGYGGFRDNWFMRVASVQDSLAMLLFLACTLTGFFIFRSKALAWYGGVVMLALAASHGPYALGVYSMSRYVLAVFPAFIVMAGTLERFRKFQWLVWITMAIFLCLLTAWFASWRWVA